MSQIKVEIGAIPATPSAGFIAIYPKADKKIYIKDDTGLETDITTDASTLDASDIPFTPSGDIIATNIQAAIQELDTEKTPIGHVGSGGVSEHAIATGAAAGFLSPSDKTKLDGVATGATLNDTDANLRARASHTGTQLAGTISDFSSAADARAAVAIASHTGEADPHAQYALDSDVDAAQAYAVQRSNHAGTQVAGTISDFNSVTDGRIDTKIATHVALADPHTQYALDSDVSLKVDKAGDSMSGALELTNLTGTAFIGFAPQNPVPSAPSAGFRMYSGSTGRIAFKGTAGIPWSLDYLGLTATRTYTFPDTSGTFMIDPATTVGDTLYRNASNITTRLPIGSEGQIKRVVSGLPVWIDENLSQDFGDASDGNLTLSGALTLTQIPYYDTLTPIAGASLNTAGFPIYCKTLDLSNAPTRSIHRMGNNGTSVAANTGGAGGAALVAAMLGGSGAGSTGATGQANNGLASAAPATQSPSNGGVGGNSGTSGAGGTGLGVAAAPGGAVSLPTHLGRFEYSFVRGISLIVGGAGGDGGSSGGGDGANTSRGGGGGGGGGGVIVIYAEKIITSASTSSGVIQANGGMGGQQNSNPAAGICGGASGAGGGGGGFIYIAYSEKTGPSVSDLITSNGGMGGNGSNGSVTGVGGAGGMGGAGGIIQIFDATTTAGTQVVGTAGSAGAAAVLTAGGVGGIGGISALTL